jgi:hypothetical protein
MVYVWIAVLVVGYTVAAVVTVEVLDFTDHANTLENLDKMILGGAWPIVLLCLPAVLTHLLIKWSIFHRQGVKRRRRLEAEAAASNDPDL